MSFLRWAGGRVATPGRREVDGGLTATPDARGPTDKPEVRGAASVGALGRTLRGLRNPPYATNDFLHQQFAVPAHLRISRPFPDDRSYPDYDICSRESSKASEVGLRVSGTAVDE